MEMQTWVKHLIRKILAKILGPQDNLVNLDNQGNPRNHATQAKAVEKVEVCHQTARKTREK